MIASDQEIALIKGVFLHDSMNATVRSFGARGDGVTDDTDAFQTAINAAYAAGGGTVIVPTGTYIIDPATGIQVKSNVCLRGTGNGSILKIKNGASVSGNLIKVESQSNVTIANFLVEGNRANQASGNNYNVYVSTSTDCRVVNVISQNCTGVGIHVYNCDAVVVRDCLSKGNLYHGFEAEQVRGCTWQGNRGTGNDLHGLELSPGEVGGTGSIGNMIIGNTFDNNTQFGIDSNAANGDISAWLNKGNIIANNSVYANGRYGIQMFKQDGNTIRGNFVYNNQYFGIYLYQSQNNVVQGNILFNNSQFGNGAYDEIMLEGYNDNNAHPSKNNDVSHNIILITGSTKARYAVNESASGDGPNIISYNTIPSAGATGTLHNQNAATTVSSPGGVLQLADNGQAIQGANAGLDSAFSHIMRLYNNFATGETQIVNPNGPLTAYVGGSKRLDVGTNGYTKIAAPASSPGTLPDSGTISFYLDEAGNNLKFAVKYSNGTSKTGTVTLS